MTIQLVAVAQLQEARPRARLGRVLCQHGSRQVPDGDGRWTEPIARVFVPVDIDEAREVRRRHANQAAEVISLTDIRLELTLISKQSILRRHVLVQSSLQQPRLGLDCSVCLRFGDQLLCALIVARKVQRHCLGRPNRFLVVQQHV